VETNQKFPEVLTVAPDVSRRESCLSAATPEKGESPPVFDILSYGGSHTEEKRRGSLAVVMPNASPSYSPYCKTGRRCLWNDIVIIWL
jgi:hypothetical protein